MARPSAEAPLMLSVSGARGIVGESMTPQVAARFAFAFGSLLKEGSETRTPLVVLGRDSRPSGAGLAQAAGAGLAASGCRVVDLGIVMTPTAGVMIDHLGAHGGIVITASHNPSQWNGVKCLDARGAAPAASEAARIIDRFGSEAARQFDIGNAPAPETDRSATRRHIERVLDMIGDESIARIRGRTFALAVDSVNGAGGPGAKALLEELGCTLHHLNAEPHGNFAHPPEPLGENLQQLKDATPRARAAAGFAQDPDADRLAIVDESGEYIGEEYTLALCALRALERASGGTDSQHVRSPILAANLSTSRMIDDVAARFGAMVVRTAVGEANVVEAMTLQGERALIGGEGNGGVILPRVCRVRDSLSAMALVLDLLAARDQPLSTIVATLPRYAMLKRKFDLASAGGRDAIPQMLQRARRRYAHARINDVDGVRIDFDEGWVHLRPSNTEPIIRLIAEAATSERAQALIDDVAAAAGLR